MCCRRAWPKRCCRCCCSTSLPLRVVCSNTLGNPPVSLFYFDCDGGGSGGETTGTATAAGVCDASFGRSSEITHSLASTAAGFFGGPALSNRFWLISHSRASSSPVSLGTSWARTGWGLSISTCSADTAAVAGVADGDGAAEAEEEAAAAAAMSQYFGGESSFEAAIRRLVYGVVVHPQPQPLPQLPAQELSVTSVIVAFLVIGVFILILNRSAKNVWWLLATIGGELKEAAKIALPVFFFATLYAWAAVRFPAMQTNVFWCYDTAFGVVRWLM